MRYEQEVDTKLAALYFEEAKRGQALQIARNDVHRAWGDRQTIVHGLATWDTEWHTVRDTEPASATEYGKRKWGEAVIVAGLALESYKIIRAHVIEQEALYTGWSRFYLVTNVDGHIHSSTGCSTCTPKTDFLWLPDVSGLTEKEAVEAHGKRLCSVCFPSAPTDWVEGYRDQTRAAVEARRAEATAKREAKEAKKAAYWADKHYQVRFTHEDGTSFLHGSDYDHRQFKGVSLKSAIKEVKEGNGYTRKGTHYDAVDLKTGKLAVDRDGKVVS